RSSGGYLLDEPPDMTPSFPRTGVSGHAGAVQRLEKIGLVKRSRDPSDLRAVLVDITPQGRAVHGESLANRRAALAALLSQLPRSDLETLRKALAPLERLASGEPASGPASNSPARKRA
ncbi:MarR family winged helix-turn-helix transcriptional regulator, partial [Mycobacterium tuberculosis]